MLRTAVVPIAGAATRMRPWSRCAPKAFAPILQRKACGGLHPRSALEVVLSDILHPSTGFEAVCLVVSPWQLPAVQRWLESESFGTSERQIQLDLQGDSLAADSWRSIADCVHLAVQPVPAGFGDAILCAEEVLQQLKSARIPCTSLPGTTACAAHDADGSGHSGPVSHQADSESHHSESDADDFAVVLGDHAFTAAAASNGGHHCFAALQDAFRVLPAGSGLTAAGSCSREEASAMGLLQLSGSAQPAVAAESEAMAMRQFELQSGLLSAGPCAQLTRRLELPRVLGMLEKPSADVHDSLLEPFLTSKPESRAQQAAAADRQLHHDWQAGSEASHWQARQSVKSMQRYACNFGIDVMPGKSTFDVLRRLKAELQLLSHAAAAGARDPPLRRELGLREVQAALAAGGRLHALRMEGYLHHDLGNPAAYWAALQHFAKCPPQPPGPSQADAWAAGALR